jgi:diguanylate cyclase (GGDEF)-like protein/PAS domain S-box-containing protein
MNNTNNKFSSGAQAKILVVDDQIELLSSLKALLISDGYEVDTANGGRSAIALLDQHPYDIALLDLQMPDLPGQEVIRHIVDQDIDVQVIVVSGEASFDSVKTSMREGAYDYIRKPYYPEEILTTVKNAFFSKKLNSQNKAMEQALKDSEGLHRYIVNNSPDIVYMLNESGIFTFVNDTLTRLLHYQRDDLIGQHYSILVHEEDLELSRYVFNERRTGERASRNVELRLRCRNPAHGVRHFDHYLLPVEINSTGIYHANGARETQSTFLGTHGVAKDITVRKETEKLINYQAYHDLLTNLPNRALFNDRLRQAIAHARRNSGMLAVMFLDLDRFKTINDSLGHAIGDQLLQSVTQKLKECLREEDTLSRFGGDEFTLLLPDIQHHDDAAIIAQKVLDQLELPSVINGHELFVSASIGISLYPDAGDSLETLCKKADIAMYNVKSNGKNGYKFFNEEMNEELTSRVTLERDLRKALEEEQFFLFFQPKVNSLTGSLSGLEALIRWEHPEKGLVLPGEFISIAEETNLIVPIGRWVFTAACKQIENWNKGECAKIAVSINVSAKQLEQADFDEFIIETINAHNISATQIELEITENAIINNRKNVIEKLSNLTDQGVRIAIDDFGTGYCSLSYLQQFPIDTLKIDRSFVNEIHGGRKKACLVNAIISLAQGLKLHLVAEGVETKQQLDYLTSLGCTEVQGHYFSVALSADNIGAVLAERSPQYYSCLNQAS